MKSVDIKDIKEPKTLPLISSATHSDNSYLNICESASINDNIFTNFKRNPAYTKVLEHVSREQGIDYLQFIIDQKVDPKQYLFNDKYGNPVTYDYSDLVISPTTLRYLKVAVEICKLFSDKDIKTVTEIGCGYGGQALILCKMLDGIIKYNMIDLPQVNKLINKYIKLLDFKQGITVNALSIDHKNLKGPYGSECYDCDLLVSNYALTECSTNTIDMYLNNIVKYAKNGYITVNFHTDQESIDFQNKLKALGKNITIIKEVPLTSPKNYILIWRE